MNQNICEAQQSNQTNKNKKKQTQKNKTEQP